MAGDKSHSLANSLSIVAVRLVRWLRAVDSSPELSGPEASAMAVIVHSGGVSPAYLAALENVRRPTMTRVVNGLVDRGLVQRKAHPTDGRAHMLFATPKGLELWEAGQFRIVAPLTERIAALDDRDRELIERALPILTDLASAPEGEDTG